MVIIKQSKMSTKNICSSCLDTIKNKIRSICRKDSNGKSEFTTLPELDLNGEQIFTHKYPQSGKKKYQENTKIILAD